MRRHLLLAAAVMATLTAVPAASYAQSRRDPEADQRKQQEEAAKKRKQKEEWGDSQAPLKALRNAGPCPFVKSLYDAARYVEFKDSREASAAVGYTGEIEGISAGCAYQDDRADQGDRRGAVQPGPRPAGRGPPKHLSLLDRRHRAQPRGPGQGILRPAGRPSRRRRPRRRDREHQTRSSSPGPTSTTCGANFEVLIGFDVTPEMAAFNRDGNRFRVNAGAAPRPPARPAHERPQAVLGEAVEAAFAAEGVPRRTGPGHPVRPSRPGRFPVATAPWPPPRR